MPKFTLILTRDTTESVSVVVEAETEDEAQDKALDNVPTEGWETDDTPNLSKNVYITNCESHLPDPELGLSLDLEDDVYVVHMGDLSATLTFAATEGHIEDRELTDHQHALVYLWFEYFEGV